MKKNPTSLSDIRNVALSKLNDTELGAIQFTMPWQTNETQQEEVDVDGFGSSTGELSREGLQQACWNKFNQNPQVSTAVQGQVGRLTGYGFEVCSDIQKIQDVLDEITFDQRNRLYQFWPKFIGRSVIEGELYLCLTVHKSGFIEVDFIDPSDVSGGGDDGIIYHPRKSTMPLFYYVRTGEHSSPILIPSIFIARYPELYNEVKKNPNFSESAVADSQSTDKAFKKLGGFKRFIVSWDKSFITKRNISHLRTILEWLNHYETLKKYEIDHKKSAGAYLWVVTMEDPKTFRLWLSMTDEERKKTGIMAKKKPGGTLVLPPGMTLAVQNPKLPNISESDTDIFHMITSGLNEPEDVTSGQSKGTYSSVKASRGPMSDRTLDEVAYFERFLRHDFWGSIFYLKTVISDFPTIFERKEAVDFKNQEPIFGIVKKRPEFLMDITFPTSEVTDVESKTRAFLGVKHGSTYDVLGIPNQEIAKKIGIGNYRKQRLSHATEQDKYPELAVAVDQAVITGQDNKKEGKKDSENTDAVPVKKAK